VIHNKIKYPPNNSGSKVVMEWVYAFLVVGLAGRTSSSKLQGFGKDFSSKQNKSPTSMDVSMKRYAGVWWRVWNFVMCCCSLHLQFVYKEMPCMQSIKSEMQSPIGTITWYLHQTYITKDQGPIISD
jgi:hypothetical protein